jgi:hypothetical protein
MPAGQKNPKSPKNPPNPANPESSQLIKQRGSDMAELTMEIMRRRWPQGDQHIPGLIEGIVKAAPTVFPKYRVKSQLAIAHFMAQASEECGQGLEMTENMNYSAKRLLEVFPTHFTPAMAERCAHNPRRFQYSRKPRVDHRPCTHA